MTPAEVVRLTLAHSPGLKARGEEIHAATARREQATAGLMPQLDTHAQAYHFEQLENQAMGPVSIPVIESQYAAAIGITQPLYTGGRTTAQRRGALFAEESARHSESATASDLTLQALNAYWGWSTALAQREAFRAGVDRMEAQTADTRNFRASGMATDNDLLAAEVALDQARLQLDEADRMMETSRIRLTRLTGREFPTDLEPCKPDSAAIRVPPPLDTALATALAHRAELAALRAGVEADTAQIAAARADNRPHLSLVARYEYGRPNSRDFPPDEEWRDDTVLGAVVSWNLFDGGLTRGRVAEAQSRANRTALHLQEAEEAVRAEVREAHLSFSHAVTRLATTRHAETSAQRNLAVATDLWKNGTARHSEVLDAQARLTDTTAQRIAAEAGVLLAQAALNHSTGTPP